MEIHGVSCTVAALSEEERIVEIRLESDQEKSILGNIYTGQVENIASNIQAAFVRLSDSVNGYLPLNQWKEMLLPSCGGTESCFFRRKKRQRTIAAWR